MERDDDELLESALLNCDEDGRKSKRSTTLLFIFLAFSATTIAITCKSKSFLFI